jgi:Endonuclease/Exonuclease/phosphatase family
MGTIAVAWWNLENLFDTDDDPISQDFEFTTANGWTEEVYAAKRANLAAVLNELPAATGRSCSESPKSKATTSSPSCWPTPATPTSRL